MKTENSIYNFCFSLFCLFLIILLPMIATAQGHWDPAELPSYLHDRGTGSPSSMFATYVRQGEWLFYPFYEYYHDNNGEYSPAELGYTIDEDHRGKFRGHEGLIFIGYGITDRFVFELEAAVMTATQHKSEDDLSTMPDKFEESGLGDVQTQFDYYWLKETENRPGAFSYLEIVYPFSKDKKLIGTPDYEFKLGTGIIRGFSWGTAVFRAAMEYSKEEDKYEVGEIALEYIKRLSKYWRIYLGIEGTEDEWEAITEIQYHAADWMMFKINNAFGVTSKASGWAPEIGAMFSLNGE
jgi:hypothetical protein